MNGIIVYIVILIVLIYLIVYRYKQNEENERKKMLRGEYLDINLYFYNQDILSNSKRRKLWIHIPFEKNARKWDNFGSRNTYELNLPYMCLCIKSIIDYCSEYYDIIIFDDTNINDILKDDIDFSKISGELLYKYREICIMKILNEYGGILVPPSLFLSSSISRIDNEDTWFVIDSYNYNSVNSKILLPSTLITGTTKDNIHLKKYIKYLEDTVLKDFGNESIHYSTNYFLKNNIPILDGALIGIRDYKNNPITLDELMSSKPVKLRSDCIGLYMPNCELLHRKIYQWYCYLSEKEVLKTNCAFSYYILKHLNNP
jgi:hypothetical protein